MSRKLNISKTKTFTFWWSVIFAIVIMIAVVIAVAMGKIEIKAQQPVNPRTSPDSEQPRLTELLSSLNHLRQRAEFLSMRLSLLENLVEQYQVYVELAKNPEEAAKWQELIQERKREIQETRQLLEKLIKEKNDLSDQIEQIETSSSDSRDEIIYKSEYYSSLLKADARKLRCVSRVKPPFRILLSAGEQRYIKILEGLTEVFEEQARGLETRLFPSSGWLTKMKGLLADINYLKTQVPPGDKEQDPAEQGYYKLIAELGDLLEKRLKQLEKF